MSQAIGQLNFMLKYFVCILVGGLKLSLEETFHSGKVPMGNKPLALSDSVTQITTLICVPRIFSVLWGLPANVSVCVSFCFYVFLSVSLYSANLSNA